MKSKVEHMNITVGNIDATVDFLKTAMPDFEVRGEGDSENNNLPYHWVHIGTPETYIALQGHTGSNNAVAERYSDVGGNHIGFVVDDLDVVIERLNKKGFIPTQDNQDHPHRRRIYVETKDGLEWEFIEYKGDSLEENNDYSL